MALQSTNIKIDIELKKQAQHLFADLGMDMSTAVNIFLRQAVKEQGIPFRISRAVPNYETFMALQEVEEMKQNPSAYKGYSDIDQMMEELLK